MFVSKLVRPLEQAGLLRRRITRSIREHLSWS